MKIFKLISKYTDKKWVLIDSSHVITHQNSAVLKDESISKVLVEIAKKYI